MKKTYLLFILCCLSFSGFSATWYSDPGGSAVTTLTNWFANAAGTGASPSTFATAGDIWIIQSNMTIPAGTWTIGGTLQFNSGRINKNGGAATIMNIGGNLTMTAATRIQTGAAAGDLTINLSGNLSMTGTSLMIHNNTPANYGYINFTNTSATLASPQTITWTSTGASQYFGLTVNAGCVVQLLSNVPAPQGSDVGEVINGTLVCGTFVMNSGNTNSVTVSSGASLYTANATGVNGAITGMTAYNYNGGANYFFNGVAAQTTGGRLPGAITATGSVTINNSSTGVTLSQNTSFASGSNLNLQNGAFINTAANLSMASGANMNRDNGTLAVTPATYSGVNLTYKNLGNNALAVTTGNEFPAAFTGTVTVNKPAATITQNASKAVTGTITLTAGTLSASVSNYNLSLTGAWTNNASATAFNPASGTVTLNGAAAQTVGGTFSTTFSGLTLNNAAGASIGIDENVTGQLTLNAGKLGIGTNNLILGAAAPAVAGTFSATSMIVANTGGQVRKQFGSNGIFLYPIGDNSNYTPITLDFTGGTYGAGAYAGVTVTGVKHPNNANVTDYLNRYWSIATSGITTPVYAVTAATYVPGDVVGTEANLSMGEYTGVLPWIKFGLTNTVTHSLSAAGISDVSSAFSGITTAVPSVSATGGTVICGGSGSAVLTATSPSGDPSFTYSWAPTGTLSAPTGVSVTATPSATTIYTLTITDGNGFTGTANVTVSVNPSPGPVTGAASFCNGTTTTLSGTIAGGTWTSGSTAVATVDPATGIVTGAAPGTSVITYIQGGCPATAIVTVNSAPAAISGPAAVCPGGTITLADIITGGDWTSSATGIATVGLSSGIVTGVTAGVVTISYTTPGCFPATYNVTVNPAPGSVIGLSTICEGNTITLTDGTPGGTWLSSNTAIATIGSATGIVNGVATGTANATYQLTATGCFAIMPLTVNAIPAPITGPTSVCVSGTAGLSDITGGGTWISSNPGVATVGAATGVVTGVLLGSVTITYKLTGSGCYVTYGVIVNSPAGPISGDTTVCPGNYIALTDAVTGGSWTSSNTSIAIVSASSGVVNGLAPGIVTITYTTGCAPVVYSITVNPLPLPIAGASHLCTGQTAILTDGSAGGSWTSSDASVASVDGITGAATGVSLGVATITYTLPTGCLITAPVTVNPIAPIAGQDSVCEGAVAYVSNIVGGGGWISSNPAIATIDPVTGMINGLDSGISFVIYTLSSGCFDSLLITVLPHLPAISAPTHVCTGSVITLADAVAGGTWSGDNAFVAGVDATTGVFTAHAPDSVHVTYTWQYGCSTTAKIDVTPLPTPVITYTATTNSLFTNSSYVTYQWYGNSTGVIPGANAPTIPAPAYNDSFYVVVTDANGCTGTSPKFFHRSLSIDNFNRDSVQVYPNPATDVVYISAPVSVRVVVSGIDGTKELEQDNAREINIKKLAAGIYFISVYDTNGQMLTVQKLLKQ